MAKVSVVMSTYNRTDRLKRAIKSVVDQSFTDWELIVVDDCSTNSPEPIISSFNDDRIKFIRLDKNFGTDTKPKNVGILASSGEYVAFLDDDNEFKPDHLLVLVKELDRDSKISVVYGDRYCVSEIEGQPSNIGVKSNFNGDLLMSQNFIDTSDVLVRKQALFDVGGFDERYQKYIDWNLWVRLYKYGHDFRRVPLVITNYYLHNTMKSSKTLDEKGFSKPAWDPIEVEVELDFLGKKEEPRVAMYSLTYDRLQYTKESFKSIRETAGYDFDHYIVDNGSKDGTRQYLLEYQIQYPDRVTLMFNEENKGIAIASNQILECIKENNKGFAIIGKIDNDAYCKTHGWLKKIVDIWKKNHRMVLSCYIQGLKDSPGGAPRLAWGNIDNELVGITQHLGGICCFSSADIRLSFVQDDKATLHYFDDLMFSKKCQENNYTMAYLENYYISHGPSGTEAQESEQAEYFERRKEEKKKFYVGKNE